MALPASGPLALTDIQTEFGGANPIGMNEYYAGGGLVPAGTSGTYGAVPSSGALSIQNFYGTSNFVPAYIEEVFSTYLYTGNGTSQTITNGIDLSTKGGMVITKARSISYGNILVDTTRGVNNALQTSTTNPSYDTPTAVTGVSTTGFSVGSYSNTNGNGQTFASWTFRKQPKFFDVVTYTGTGAGGNVISHNLGSIPGCIIIKATSTTSSWFTWHIGSGISTSVFGFELNSTAVAGLPSYDGSSYFTSTTFLANAVFNSSISEPNQAGVTYVAYLFAHNAGGFGLTGTDNVISCGAFIAAGPSSDVTVNLGYEPQWILMRAATAIDDWYIYDVMRGMSYTMTAFLKANTSAAEGSFTSPYGPQPTATGFIAKNSLGWSSGETIIYISIRRGPMKVPTVGTSVFTPTATSASTGTTITTNITSDMHWAQYLDGDGQNTTIFDRLRGVSSISGVYNTNYKLVSSSTDVEATGSSGSPAWVSGFTNTGWVQGSYAAGAPGARYDFTRAPRFFDVVCYTGTSSGFPGTPQTLSHNLGVVPELIIIKRRNGSDNWFVYPGPVGVPNGFFLNATIAVEDMATRMNTTPTSTTFNVRTDAMVNASGSTYVAYLFATCAGVSKVGLYTGTGALQTINCGFSTGARFVLIKRTNGTGDWYVWDSARGITSGNDPYFIMNVGTNAQVTGTNYVDTTSVGFQVTAAAPAGLNASGGSYFFLAIA